MTAFDDQGKANRTGQLLQAGPPESGVADEGPSTGNESGRLLDCIASIIFFASFLSMHASGASRLMITPPIASEAAPGDRGRLTRMLENR